MGIPSSNNGNTQQRLDKSMAQLKHRSRIRTQMANTTLESTNQNATTQIEKQISQQAMPFLHSRETMEHDFISCQRLQPLWAYVNLLLQKLGNTTVTNLQEAVLRTDDPLSEYLVTPTIFGIWQTRKRKIFNSAPTPDLIKQLKERIKQRNKIDQYNKRKNRLQSIWTNKGIFATFKHNELKFNI